ncbi:MAG TPA: NAD-dependent epimerase/dehydratase family protein [Vicinamibacterales bacterium]|nr:NAD-dependent epimerase/dehydratase family protein [Vicinamibacterales bacterium]
MRSLFITGGTGFMGRRVLRQLVPADFRGVVCLRRRGDSDPPAAGPIVSGVSYVQGDLRNPETYRRHLAGCDTVLHLAAATGPAPREESMAVNADGTRALVRESEKAGVRDFLLVSTIAVKYPNPDRYPYAGSKRLAEAAVRESGLRYAIVRPTIVIGDDAPIWRTLAGLARRRVILMPGTGRVRVQPIHVDDVAAQVLTLVKQDLFGNQIFELGGHESVTFEEFLRRVHWLGSGREPTVIHLPLGPILATLTLLEPVLDAVLPVKAGQFYAFRYDSTVDPGARLPTGSASSLGLDDMIRRCLANG